MTIFRKKIICLLSFMVLNAHALGAIAFDPPKDYEIDEKEKIGKVALVSGKKDDTRFYEAKMSVEMNSNIEKALKAVLNFDERCNNEQASKRKFWDKNKKCSQKNSNLVESVVIKDLKARPEKVNGQVASFVVLRRIYKRESFNHFDLIRVIKEKASNGKDRYVVTQRMLDNGEAKKYVRNFIKRESAFLNAQSRYVLEEAGNNKTKLSYVYQSYTDHWLLNKSLASGEVFESMAESFGLLESALNNLVKKDA